MHEYEAHLSSYDHQHKQRLKDMKAMVKDPTAASRARKLEQKEQGVISIKLGDAASSSSGGGLGGGFKKGGFKKTGFKAAFVPVGGNNATETKDGGAGDNVAKKSGDSGLTKAAPKSELIESDTEDEGYEVYDPREPTD